MMVDVDWRQKAACRDYNPELWFSSDEQDRVQARFVCLSCPVRPACTEFGVRIHMDVEPTSRFGMFGDADFDRPRLDAREAARRARRAS